MCLHFSCDVSDSLFFLSVFHLNCRLVLKLTLTQLPVLLEEVLEWLNKLRLRLCSFFNCKKDSFHHSLQLID